MKRVIATLHPLWQAVVALGLLSIILDFTGLFHPPGGGFWVLGVVVVLLGAGLLLNTGAEAGRQQAVEVASPVRGEWLAVNSPGQQVPSHGVRILGQLSAVDLLQPDGAAAGETNPPMTRWGLRGSRPEEFRCFGEPICAVADGIAVAVSDIQRDQRARNTWQALTWFMTGENILRAVAGWRAVIGNRVVLKHDDGVYSAYAHIKRRSAQVAVGDRIQRGQQIAAVGNTGNTTQPHLHVQLMDRARFPAAAGLSMSWPHITLGGMDPVWQKHAKAPDTTAVESMPRNGQLFSA